ncbi:hypothetical protein ACVWYN_002910 [Pedobacter sp. UYP24]
MKTIFDEATRSELIHRINSLSENNKAEWGKMNVIQMLKHCNVAEEMYLGLTAYKRTLLGRIIGPWVLRGLINDDVPMHKNAPTSPDFIIKETDGDIAAEKNKWIGLINAYANYNNPLLLHWFFGKMTKDQVGVFVYKHADHHLRQFGA